MNIEPDLTIQQKAIVEAALKGENIFMTGPAGVGKSFTLSRVLDELKACGKHVYVTASTGIAALAVGGTTLHSFSGIGLGQEPVAKLVQKVTRRADLIRRWKRTDVLIIDEISMIDGHLLDKIEQLARIVRKKEKRFGGIQVIFTGDFAQLPPVTRKGEQQKLFAFESQCWRHLIDKTIYLTTVFRQNNQTFVRYLHAIRCGIVDKETIDMLNDRVNATLPDDGIMPTKLYSHRNDVERENQVQLERLPGVSNLYKAVDTGSARHKIVLDKQCLAKSHIKLKVNAQVVLLKNLDAKKGLVNGARGVVVQMLPEDVLVKFECGERYISPMRFEMMVDGKCVASRTQLPLMLGYAMSIHKSQGMSLDRAEVDLSRVFENGQAYVALSRVRSLDGLRILRKFNPNVLRANDKVLEYYKNMKTEDEPALKKIKK